MSASILLQCRFPRNVHTVRLDIVWLWYLDNLHVNCHRATALYVTRSHNSATQFCHNNTGLLGSDSLNWSFAHSTGIGTKIPLQLQPSARRGWEPLFIRLICHIWYTWYSSRCLTISLTCRTILLRLCNVPWEHDVQPFFLLYPPSKGCGCCSTPALLWHVIDISHDIAEFPLSYRWIYPASVNKEFRSLVDTDALLPCLPLQDDVLTCSWLIRTIQINSLYHMPLTAFLWTATLMLALVASSLSDVVNVLGCTTGTPIAFLQPPLLAWRLQDYSLKSTTLFTVCFSVGCIGTYFSLHTLF